MNIPSNSTPHILLTGGAGYIGSHTALALLEAGYKVTVIDNLCNSSARALASVEQITGKSLHFVQADLLDAQALNACFAHGRFDAVIHFAALKAVAQSSEIPLDYYINNVQGTFNLLRSMQHHKVGRLVYSSSATVYGTPHFLPYTEAHPTAPINPYGNTKLHIEQLLKDLAASAPGWGFSLLRYFNPVGAHESGDLGEDPRGIPNNLMPYITQVAIGKRPHLNIFGGDYDTPDGTCVRDYIHVCDLAQAHLAATRHLLEQPIHTASYHDIFNLGSGQGYSVKELVKAFSDANQIDIPTLIAPRRAGDLPAFWADPAKANAAFGWRTQYSLEDMCRSSWRWQQKHPSGFHGEDPAA